jgi:F5/8 type C domain
LNSLGNPNTYWHTQWHDDSPGLPHEIIIELIPPSIIKGFAYLPRQDESDHGTIKDFEFYVSNDGKDFGSPVKKSTFEPGKEEKIEIFAPMKCRFIKLKALSEINGLPWTSAAEIGVIQNDEDASARPKEIFLSKRLNMRSIFG